MDKTQEPWGSRASRGSSRDPIDGTTVDPALAPGRERAGEDPNPRPPTSATVELFDGRSAARPTSSRRSPTGIPGLDDILGGGFPSGHLFLIRGKPGTGKTTLAMQFLLEGRRLGEDGLYITLSETKEELALVAQSHGWSLDGVAMIELSVIEERLKPGAPTTLLHPGEVDLNRVVKLLESEVETRKPRRLVLDSLAELRLMAQNPLRYRRQILALKSFFATRGVTVLFLDDGSADANDPQIESIAHGVIELEHLRPEFGTERRRLSVLKLRGVRFRGGFHDYTIETGGLVVYPRLVAAEHKVDFERGQVSSGIQGLDRLIGGGLDRGTSTLFLGPAGSGKSTLALQFACAAAKRGDKVAHFAFDENLGTLGARARGLGLDLEHHVRSGIVQLKQVDPAELAPGEFSYIIRDLVENAGVRMIVIDSLNGYLNAMPDERFLVIQLHEILTFLAQRGVTTLLVLAQHGLVGSNMQSPVDLTYLADTVLLLRYFEFSGAIKKAVSVIKKRSGGHESTIRELSMLSDQGIRVGEPLDQFRGVLTGIPTYFGSGESIAKDDGGDRAR